MKKADGRLLTQDSDENLLDLAAEAGHDIAAVKLIRFRKPSHVGHRAIDTHAPLARVHNPHGPRARREPVLDLLVNLLVAVAGAEDFDGEVGGRLPEVFRDPRLRDSLAPDEGDVGGAHCVRVTGNLESGLRAESLPQVNCFY